MAQATKKASPVTKPKQDNCSAITNPAARRACIRAAGAKKKNKIIDTGTPNNPNNPVSRKKNRQY